MHSSKYDCLIFDLDGTISDPKDGIVRSVNHALNTHNFDPIDEQKICTLIGPPIDFLFSTLTESDDQNLITSLIASYRERYSDIGFAENKLYPGIVDVLNTLNQHPTLTLGVCTSKRVDFAQRILDLFNLSECFQFVDGGEVGMKKSFQLHRLLDKGLIRQDSIMIGDREADLIAANDNRLDCAGVLWGYGPIDELRQHNPNHIFYQPEELLDLCKSE
ncbi:HAD hydrolase-like protein [Endozoicomonas arenosclerae]|uniref:HAD hydrolase-like protein n=1 Tax=Endozoicomonas arenosclerae TaxID=1633495 RepID=UPI0007857DB0|nr:HAD hydrolase-like protein [Endozoicomonas arenosclerae]